MSVYLLRHINDTIHNLESEEVYEGTLANLFEPIKRFFTGANKQLSRPMNTFFVTFNRGVDDMDKLGLSRAGFIDSSKLAKRLKLATRIFKTSNTDKQLVSDYINLTRDLIVFIVESIFGRLSANSVDLSKIVTVDDILALKLKDSIDKKLIVIFQEIIQTYIRSIRDIRNEISTNDLNASIDGVKILAKLDQAVRVIIDQRFKKLSQRQGIQNKHEKSSGKTITIS